MSPPAAGVVLMESRKMCLVCFRQHKMGTCLSSEGEKAHGKIGRDNFTNDASMRKFTGKILTSSSEKLYIIRKEGFTACFERNKPNTHWQISILS